MNNQTLTKLLPHVEYESDTGNLYLVKDNKRFKRLLPDENNLLHTSIQGTRIKIKFNRFIWFVLYKELLSSEDTILHKDLDDTNFRRNNLTKVPKKVYFEILQAMKNLSGSLRLIPHPTDAFACILEFKHEGRIKRETISDISVARKKLLHMQIRYIKFLGRYVVSE